MQPRDFKYHKLINKIDTRMTQYLTTLTKQSINPEKMSIQSNNPFMIHPFPPVTLIQIPNIIFCLAKSIEEISIKNLSLTFLEHFVVVNQDALVKVLCEKTLHCHLFCLTFIRYLQQYAKIKEFSAHINKMNLFPFIDLFCTIIQRRRPKKFVKPIKVQQKQTNNQIHTIFLALTLATCSKYLKQCQQQENQQVKHVQMALMAACAMIEQSENQLEYEVIRQYLSISSNILIFNGLTMRPLNLLQFSLNNDQKLYLSKQHSQEINPSIVFNYLRCLNTYSKKDELYHQILLKIIKNLLTLNINNVMLLAHFQIIVELIKHRSCPSLKKQIFQILIENHSKRNMIVVDQIFTYLLGSGIDLLDDDIQKYMLTLAEYGDQKRKQKFTIIYYDQYEKIFNRVHSPIINFIFEVYLEQDLKFQKIELMVSNQALIISKNNICKLHTTIKCKNLNKHINLLSIILQKRKDNFQVSHKASPHSFICEQWLQQAGNHSEILKTYCKIIAETLCGKTLQVYPSLINLHSCVVRVNFMQHSQIREEYLIRSLEFYSMILKMAEKNQIFEQTVFRYMILLQALFGDKLTLDSFSYFSSNFSKIIHPESTFLTYLQYLVTLLKNRSSVLLYLQAVLEFQMNLNELFFQKKLYDISFLTRLIQQSEYFRVSTYSFESITVIYELSLNVKNQQFQSDYYKIVRYWSHLMSRTQCKNITYFFAFREIKKIYPFMKERQMKNPSDRIKMIWDLVLNLIDQKGINGEYLSLAPNDLVITWKGEENSKKDLKISGVLLRNQSMELFWSIFVKTTQKNYIISINNDKVIVQVEQFKQINRQFVEIRQVLKEIKINELKKRPQKIQFLLKLQNQSKKTLCHFSILQTALPGYHFDGNIQQIILQYKANAILKEILIMDCLQSTGLQHLKNHIHSLNQWQIKISSLNKYSLQNYSDKFDFIHAFCCIGEMLKNFNYITIPFAYDIFIRISIRVIKHMHNNNNSHLLQMMMEVFNTIENKYSTLRGRGKTLQPIIEIQNVKQYAKELYYLFTFAILPQCFWSNFNEQTKLQMTNKLKQLIKCEEFRDLENSHLTVFHQVLLIAYDYQLFFDICTLIIDHHEFNEVLSRKFKRFILMSKQSSIHLQHFNKYLDKNIKYLNIQNEKFVENRLRWKYITVDSQCIKQIFTLCSINSKIILLHYLSQNPSFDVKGQPKRLHLIKQLMQKMNIEQKYELMPWLIIQIKQLICKLKQKTFEESSYNFRVNYLHLELLLLNRYACHQTQKQQVQSFILQLLKILKSNLKRQKYKNQLENFIQSSTYMDFIVDITRQLLGKYDNIKKIDKDHNITIIYQLSIGIITKFEKNNFLQFLIKYRYKCCQDHQLLKALIENDQFKNLQLSHYSIFLQFLFEILLLIQHKFIFNQHQNEQIVTCITEYIQLLFHNIDEKTKIKKSLFYSYPHLTGHKECMKDINKISKRIEEESKAEIFLEIRGGIYFKCVLIIIKLMKLNPNLDYSNLVDYFLFGSRKSQKQDKTFKLFSKFGSNDNTLIKQRSLAEHYMNDAHEDHKNYFNKDDTPYPYHAYYQETDLNSFIADYFLMSIAQLLQEKSENMDPQLLQKYNNIFILGCMNQKINKEMLIPNQSFQVLNYEIFCSFLKPQSDKINQEFSPLIPLERTPSTPQKSNYKLDKLFYESPHSEKEIQFGFSSSPKRRIQRRKTEDFTNQSKKRNEILELIKLDHKNWYKKQVCKNISTYFCERAKQIRILELIHTHFVLNNPLFTSTITSSKMKQDQDKFTKIFFDLLFQEKKHLLGQFILEDKLRKVKKIHPYTSSKPPVLNILENTFWNMACPITSKITKTQYRIRRLKSQQSMNMNFYLASKQWEEEFSQKDSSESDPIQTSLGRINSLTEDVQQVEEQQHFLSKQKPYCELITRQGAYFCQYHFESHHLVLTSKMQRHICEKLWYLKLGTPDENLLHAQITIQINPLDVHEIFYRRFNQITNNSLQFFMKNGTSKFISFYRKQFLSVVIKHIQKVFKGVKIIKDASKQFEDCKFTQKWIDGYLSNFDYLMLLNKYSGRSYNDLNQYYVFPWILKDYHSDKIDLTNPDIYRDLDKPIGALNPQKLKRYKDKYRNQTFNPQRCLYGSHYSASLIIFYYLVRLEPYSSLHREMQKGTWDVADRLFSSIKHVWESLMSQSSATDIKQCIPEFYYMPAFLRNIAHIELGQKQCGTDVEDVELPPWAHNAEEFIVTLRAALESDIVSQNLHLWIDLIFGKHQNSEERNNIFHPYSYSDPEVLQKMNSKNHKNLEGIICHISYFGQCPLQLFKKQHRPKKTWAQLRPKSYKSIETHGNSESTSSQKFWGQAPLLSGWKVKKISSDNNEFILEIKHMIRPEKANIIISPFANQTILKESLENLIPYKKEETKTSNEPKISINCNKQMLIGKEFIMDLDFKFNFEHTEINELWIACFGIKGLKIFNWQLEECWSWKGDEVKQVNLEPTRLIFSTCNGKLFFYSFLDKKLQQIIVFKDVYDMKIKVICLPRLPSRQKNQINYKILCVGDESRVSLVSYTFEQTMNHTSLSRNSLY